MIDSRIKEYDITAISSHPTARLPRSRAVLLYFCVAFLCPCYTWASDPTEERQGFVALSDGKSFDGWNQTGNWVLDDGAFYRKSRGGPLTYTAAKVPDDFELRFDWKVSVGCNSGVYYRPGQVEYQVLDNHGSPYGENARQAAASLFFCMAPSKDATRPVGQWNTARIVCQGSVIEHWLNNERVLSFDYNDPKWKWHVELLAARSGDLTGRNGQLWLQDHGQDVWFRNLRWRAIPQDEVIVPDSNFEPMPVTGQTLAKEEARVRAMLAARETPQNPVGLNDCDVCIYGGTSGGVVAAVQAARMGKSVVLIEPGKHLGGMMAGGLSWSDVGSAERAKLFGGLAREVFERIGRHYGQDPKTVFDVTAPESEGRSRKGVDFIRPPSLAFEPKVAEKVFTDMAREAGVHLRFGAALESVIKDGTRLQKLNLADGSSMAAKMFIDATYEGDLMARAGVNHTLGREANAQYGEKGNGVRGPEHGPATGKFSVEIDPFVKPGDPTSGLLPLISGDAPEPPGSADKRIQSYNYRLCLTDDPTNRVPLDPPANYQPADWELLGRYVEAMKAGGAKLTLRDFCKYDPLPNRKFDFNNRWPISTDLLGGADGWPEGSAADRAVIAKAHEDYLRGFFRFLCTDPRVPENVREEASRFGLPRDEFPDNRHWPHQLYVREARRMVGDLIMTEHHIRNERVAPNAIAIATYPMDIHAVRRVYHHGKLYNEGYGEGGGKPAPIGYGAIVPKAAECANLFVTFALSSSHAAFGSIRMEPVFMVTSQSAATAAVLAINENVTVQAMDYAKLKTRLLADKQILDPSGAPRGIARTTQE